MGLKSICLDIEHTTKTEWHDKRKVLIGLLNTTDTLTIAIFTFYLTSSTSIFNDKHILAVWLTHLSWHQEGLKVTLWLLRDH